MHFLLQILRKKNLSDVYHYIYHNPGCPKQAIANALSISLPTVSQHLSTLTDHNLIKNPDSSPQRSVGAQPPTRSSPPLKSQ